MSAVVRTLVMGEGSCLPDAQVARDAGGVRARAVMGVWCVVKGVWVSDGSSYDGGVLGFRRARGVVF